MRRWVRRCCRHSGARGAEVRRGVPAPCMRSPCLGRVDRSRSRRPPLGGGAISRSSRAPTGTGLHPAPLPGSAPGWAPPGAARRSPPPEGASVAGSGSGRHVSAARTRSVSRSGKRWPAGARRRGRARRWKGASAGSSRSTRAPRRGTFAANARRRRRPRLDLPAVRAVRDAEAYASGWSASCLGDDPLFHAIVDARPAGRVGVASYLRIDPAQRLDRGRPPQLLAAAAAHARPRPRRCT